MEQWFCLKKSWAGEGFVALFEWSVTMVQCLITSCGEGDVLIVFGENLLHVGSVEVSQHNKGSFWIFVLKSSNDIVRPFVHWGIKAANFIMLKL